MKKIIKKVDWWVIFGLPVPATEYKFMIDRKFRFDWAWPAFKIAVEQECGILTRGRHTRGSGFAMDMQKYNLAGLHGWRVFRFQPRDIIKGNAQAFMLKVFEATNPKTILPLSNTR